MRNPPTLPSPQNLERALYEQFSGNDSAMAPEGLSEEVSNF